MLCLTPPNVYDFHNKNKTRGKVNPIGLASSSIIGILTNIKQRAGDRGITTENMEKSQYTDLNQFTTNECVSVASSNVRL